MDALTTMEGPLAKQNPSAPNRYSIRTFVLDGSGLRFRGARRADGEAPAEHRIDMDEVASLRAGNGGATAFMPGENSDATSTPEGADFQIHLKRDAGICLQLRARSRDEAFRWLLALSEASGVRVDVPHDAVPSDRLPIGWEAVPVASTEQRYYRNTKTHQQQWAPPTIRGAIRSANQSSTGGADRVFATEASADAARLDAEIREMKAARRRRKRDGLSDVPSNDAPRGIPSDEPNEGDSTRLQPQLSRRGLELQASIAELSSRRQSRRQRRREDRKRALWNAGAVVADQHSDPAEVAQKSVAAGASESGSLTSEERVAARMAQLLHAAFPNEAAHSRVCNQITGNQDTMVRRRQMAKEAGSCVPHSHPEAPVPALVSGAFVAAAIVDKPTNATKAAQFNPRNDPAMAHLRSELERLRPSELRRRALRAHVPVSLLGEAQDSSDPKSSVIALLVQYEMYSVPTEVEQLPAAVAHVPMGEEHEDLGALRPSEVRRRALALGIEQSKLDEAQDSIHPKQAIAHLILVERRRQLEQLAVNEQNTRAVIDSAKADVVAAREELRRAQDAAETAVSEAASVRSPNLERTTSENAQDAGRVKSAQTEDEAFRVEAMDLTHHRERLQQANVQQRATAGLHPPLHGVGPPSAPPPLPYGVWPPSSPPPPPMAKPSGKRADLMADISTRASLMNVESTEHDDGGERDKLLFALNSTQAARRLKHTSTVDKSGPMLSTMDGMYPHPDHPEHR